MVLYQHFHKRVAKTNCD